MLALLFMPVLLAAAGTCPNAPSLVTAPAIIAISPAAATCAGAAFPAECATAQQALPHILDSFALYGIAAPRAQAALLSLMLSESGGFQFNRNHFPSPGRAGQGTRNMQSPAFNLLYAQAVLPASTVSAAQAQGPDAVLQLVQPDNFSFGSAAWFLRANCPTAIYDGLAAGTVPGWEAYLTQCLGTTVTPDRTDLWMKAIAALGA